MDKKFPIEFEYTLRGEKRVANCRCMVGLDELMEVGQRMWVALSNLKDSGIWFAAIYMKKRLVAELFSDAVEGGEEVELLYESDFYECLSGHINPRLLADVELMFDTVSAEVSHQTSLDRLLQQVSATLTKWDAALTESIDMKSAGKLVKKLAGLKLDQKTIVTEMVEAINKDKVG